MLRKSTGMLGAIAVLGLGALTTAAHAQSPVLSGSYGWEDGKGTILGSFGNLIDPTNTGAIDGVTPNSGTRMLRVTEGKGGGTPQAYVAFIEGLEDGDIIQARFNGYDDVPGEAPRLRIWGHYALSGDPDSYAGSASGSNDYTSGTGWEELSHEWEFDSDGGTRDALMVEVRLYSPTGDVNVDYFVDDVSVDVFCAENPDLTITFPDGSVFGDPAAPGPDCVPDKPCDPTPFGSYGWEDELYTAFNTTGNVTQIENTGAVNGISPNSGQRMLRVRQGDPGGTPQVWVAFVENLEDGDEITASAFGYDDTPDGSPSLRIWGHYAISGDPSSEEGSASGSFDFTPGDGWGEVSHVWEFDSDGGTRDALMIEMRLYAADENTDFYIDDISVDVCSDNPNVTVSYPSEGEPPAEPCDLPDGEPTLEGSFGWEDGESTILGSDTDEADNVQAANVDDPVLSGKRGLRVTESPHEGTPKVFLAYIEHLEDGDTIHGRFNTLDDIPGNPQVRIWGRSVFSGDINSFDVSAGGNENYSSGDGWEELCHTWEFDSGDANRDALVIEARLYSENASCEECSTDYFFDDMYVAVFGNSNATITLPDGSVIGEPPLLCPADLDESGSVDSVDLFALLGAWASSDADADVNNDGVVDGHDLGILLASWGDCPAEYLSPMPGSVELVVESSDAGGGLVEHKVFVELDNADDSLVNVYDANVNFSGSFESDSYIAIGQESASVVPDPNFDDFGFSFGIGMGDDAGWYNEDPDNDLGRAGDYPDNRVLITSLTMDAGESADGELSVTYNNADGRAVYGTATFDTAAVPPTCDGDINGDNTVNVSDLLALLGDWGSCAGCDSDLNGDDVVNVSDMLALLGNWGPCN